jgi:hypothetical protein
LQVIKRLLENDKVDINIRNDVGEAPLHTLVRRKAVAKKNSDGFECLWNFLVYCNSKDFDINVKNKQQEDTALLIAAEVSVLPLVTAWRACMGRAGEASVCCHWLLHREARLVCVATGYCIERQG